MASQPDTALEQAATNRLVVQVELEGDCGEGQALDQLEAPGLVPVRRHGGPRDLAQGLTLEVEVHTRPSQLRAIGSVS